GEDVARANALLEQVSDAACDDARLAAAGPGDDEERPVRVLHRLALRLREVREVVRRFKVSHRVLLACAVKRLLPPAPCCRAAVPVRPRDELTRALYQSETSSRRYGAVPGRDSVSPSPSPDRRGIAAPLSNRIRHKCPRPSHLTYACSIRIVQAAGDFAKI